MFRELNRTEQTLPALHLLNLAGGRESFPGPALNREVGGWSGSLHHHKHTAMGLATGEPAGMAALGPDPAVSSSQALGRGDARRAEEGEGERQAHHL